MKNLPHPYCSPEPHYIPGYTGHCPHYQFVVGRTYGCGTHDVMGMQPFPPQRLQAPPLYKCETNSLEKNGPERKLAKTGIALGYTGHIPTASYHIGVNFTKSCSQGFAKIEEKKALYKEVLKTSSPTRED
ncbi:hypothetical protein JTE90_023739 [Oedothorax gibbosus]|uniref:Ciliary microtubule inner protein 2A-C-like domain-containing protein n=1 Tax=Oedothorax gibbosus TaxID=931172 RepID=A0AAV6VA67_9ARAC|nr:hypothetical protein JTE90_023739 [Oedothorax gibbosus]